MNVMLPSVAVQLSTQQSAQPKSNNLLGSASFGSLLSQNVEQLNESANNTLEAMSTNEIGQLTALLHFLQLEDLSQIEQGEQRVEEMVVSDVSLEEHPIIQQLTGLNETQSMEDILASLLMVLGENQLKEENAKNESLLTGQEHSLLTVPSEENTNEFIEEETLSLSVQSEDILPQLQEIITRLSEGTSLPSVREQQPLVYVVVKFSKLYSLMKNQLDLSAKQVEQLNQLKQSLDQLALKLEAILQSTVKATTNTSFLLNRQNYVPLNVMQNTVSTTGEAVSNPFISEWDGQVISTSTNKEGIGLHNPFMSMSKTEQYIFNTQNTKIAESPEQLQKSFESILSKAQFSNNNGVQKLLIKLNPENLGTLRIELLQRDGIMTARIIASTAGAKELLDDQLQGLKQAFLNQNIPVEKIELSQQFTDLSQERNFKREQSQQQNSENQQQTVDEEELLEDFQNAFEQALLQEEVQV